RSADVMSSRLGRPRRILSALMSALVVAGVIGGVVVDAAGPASAAGPATHFSVSAPSSALTGYAFTFTVTALDASNAVATGYSGTVAFTSSDAAAILPAPSTLTNGTRTFSATLHTPGSQTITATDPASVTSPPVIIGTSGTIAVFDSITFVVSAPSAVTSGSSFSLTVTAKNGATTVTGYSGTVHFTSSDGAAVLPANYTF